LPKNSKYILRREERWQETPDSGCPTAWAPQDLAQVMGALSVAKGWT